MNNKMSSPPTVCVIAATGGVGAHVPNTAVAVARDKDKELKAAALDHGISYKFAVTMFGKLGDSDIVCYKLHS